MAPENDADQLPLRGIVLCCTSLSQDVRTRLAQVATEMGASHKLDLTADVTHLIVGKIDTPKYRYVAKERPDIKVLSPEFIDRAREIWTDGGEVDVATLEKECRLPTFFGLEICLTGVTDQNERDDMKDTVNSQGAEYTADLHRGVSHLIAAKPEGAKYTHGKQWGIKVVGLKWYEDSLQRGMALDEALYLPELPREQQGIGAYRTRVRQPTATSFGKRARVESKAGEVEKGSDRKRLRKSASLRLGGQSQDLWQSFSQHEVQVDVTETNVWDDTNAESQTLRDSLGPNSKRRSMVSETYPGPEVELPQGLFSGHYVLIHGFVERRAKLLRNAIEANGAVVVSSSAELEDASEQASCKLRCLLMPHDKPVILPRIPPGTVMVTEWWVERCVHFKQTLHPGEDALSQPLHDALIPAFQKLIISATGFDSVDRRMSAEAVKLMGGSFEQNLSPSTNILLCASGNPQPEKAAYASKHNIPVVRVDWLYDSLKSKGMVPMESYRFELPPYDPSALENSSRSSPMLPTAAPVRASRDVRSQGEEPVHPKRLSNTRKRHAAAALPLQSSKPKEAASVPRSSRARAPLFHEDDSDHEGELPAQLDDLAVPSMSAPTRVLKEIPPNASQHRSENGSQEKQKPTPAADNEVAVTEASISPPKSPRKGHSPSKQDAVQLASNVANIRKLIGSGQETTLDPQKRKARKLGRNASGTSLLTTRPGSASASCGFETSVAEDEEENEANGFAPSKEPAEVPPSTQLGYYEPEAEAHRQQMSRNLGLLEESTAGKRVASVGTVKDSEDVAGRATGATGAAAAAGGRHKARLGRNRA